jgi:hypothetical protein
LCGAGPGKLGCAQPALFNEIDFEGIICGETRDCIRECIDRRLDEDRGVTGNLRV